MGYSFGAHYTKLGLVNSILKRTWHCFHAMLYCVILPSFNMGVDAS